MTDSSRKGIDLYELLPSLYRLRDSEAGGPLRDLLDVIQESLTALEQNVAQLYDDWFIATCRDEMIGYFADLLGVPLSAAPSTPTRDQLASSSFADARRKQVANALLDRRRKGTLTALDEVAADATGWPSRTQELRRAISVTQSARHPEPASGRLVPIGDNDRLDRLGTPFSEDTVLADVRRVNSHRSQGVAQPDGVAIVLWRLLANGADRGEAYCVDDDTHFTFDALGRDLGLAVNPQRRRPGAPPAADLDVATPITRQMLHFRLEDYYGEDRSLAIYVGSALIPRHSVVVADLSDRRARLGHGTVAIDPVLGRFAFASRPSVEHGVSVLYRHLQPAPIGGGIYPRTNPARAKAVYQVAARGDKPYRKVSSALRRWRNDREQDPRSSRWATIEIFDDATYIEHLAIKLQAGEHLDIRAAPGHRPVLRPVDEDYDRPERLWVDGLETPPDQVVKPDDLPTLTLDGITVAGHAVTLRGALGEVAFRHCTLVPSSRRGEGSGAAPTSLDVEATPCSVAIADSIVGRIVVASAETGHDPIQLAATDAVLDGGESGSAIEGTDHRDAYVTLNLERVTVLGSASVHRVGLVQNSIITGPLTCEHRQTGELRFSALPASSRTPRRTSCQPDGVIEQVDARLPETERRRRQQAEARRVSPVFDSVRLGHPGYARVIERAPDELRRGADDEGELGAHHDLWLSRRMAELLIRLAEFTPAGTDCGPVFAT